MGDKTAIQWTDASWNPTVGCTHLTPGCDNCYAARTASSRLAHLPLYDGIAHDGVFTGEVRLAEERLEQPMRWGKPRMIFVDSMSDLFHQDVPDEFIAKVFAVMAATPRHTYQILTKRHGRMRALLSSSEFWLAVQASWYRLALHDRANAGHRTVGVDHPLPNVWLGVSVEDQKRADLRVPALLDTPADVRFLSCEPLLGAVRLDEWLHDSDCPPPENPDVCICRSRDVREVTLDWVIVGGESGPAARPMHPQWACRLRDQCSGAEVPFFFKQWGEWKQVDRGRATHLLHSGYAHDPDGHGTLVDRKSATMDHPYGQGSGLDQDLVDRGHAGWIRVRKVGVKAAGRKIGGRTWDQMPEPFRQQESLL